MRGATRDIGRVFRGAGRPFQDSVGCGLIGRARRKLEPVQQLSIVETGAGLLCIRETRAERGLFIGTNYAEIAQREILEILFGLAKIQIEQELDRLGVIERDEPLGPQISIATSKLISARKNSISFGFGHDMRTSENPAAFAPWIKITFGRQVRNAAKSSTPTARMTTPHEITGCGLDVADLGIFEEMPVKDGAAPIDHTIKRHCASFESPSNRAMKAWCSSARMEP